MPEKNGIYRPAALAHDRLDKNTVFDGTMAPHVVFVVEIRVTDGALKLGLLAAHFSGVPAQRLSVLVPVTAHVTSETRRCIA